MKKNHKNQKINNLKLIKIVFLIVQIKNKNKNQIKNKNKKIQ